jgi:hypothetical protein
VPVGTQKEGKRDGSGRESIKQASAGFGLGQKIRMGMAMGPGKDILDGHIEGLMN